MLSDEVVESCSMNGSARFSAYKSRSMLERVGIMGSLCRSISWGSFVPCRDECSTILSAFSMIVSK